MDTTPRYAPILQGGRVVGHDGRTGHVLSAGPHLFDADDTAIVAWDAGIFLDGDGVGSPRPAITEEVDVDWLRAAD